MLFRSVFPDGDVGHILINEMNERQDILAADDLINFCIHARRLVDNMDLRNLLREAKIETSDKKAAVFSEKILREIHE